MSYPIVLAHGVCRFDKVWSEALELDNNDDPKLDQLHYFKGLRTDLMKHGFTVYHSNVSWAADVETRASELKDYVIKILEKEGAEKVNIIAHSMGGLDERHMLFNFRDSDHLHERVASLTTISTPHEGSPFADWGTDNLSTRENSQDGPIGILKSVVSQSRSLCEHVADITQYKFFEHEVRLGQIYFKIMSLK